MSVDWVDFQQVKQAVSLAAVLQEYGVDWLRPSGRCDHLRGRCPIHGQGGADAFHVSLQKNAFYCFYCQQKGNVLDLVAALEKCSVRQAALRLQQRFGLAAVPTYAPTVVHRSNRKEELVPEKENDNPPLPFTLSPLNCAHPYLQRRGISAATAEAFGAGYFDSRGLMRGRLVIPIHNEQGRLVAYSGRAIDHSVPKYKFPARFRKSLVLFNLHRAQACGRSTVVVVEGFFDCMKVDQAGWPSVVALMGSSLSVQQELLLCTSFKCIVLLLDGDEAGRKGTLDIVARLSRKCRLRVCQLGPDQQPDQLSSEQIRKGLECYTQPW
jgi:DNA primase